MKTITVQPNQTIWDVIIMATGSAEAGMQFCGDNGISISDVPVAGSVYVVSAAALELGDAGVTSLFSQKGIIVGTLGGDGGLAPVVVMGDESDSVVVDESGSAIFGY